MQKTLYIVRHAQATGQDPAASLTAEGEQQAIRLADHFASLPIERILSSPSTRATRSIAPLARRLELPIITDDRLTERVLSSSHLVDWMSALRASFDDLELCFPGGESSRAAMQRAVAVLNDLLGHSVLTSMIVTHGNLMTLLLKHFNPAIGFAHWQQLTNPDVYRVELAGGSMTLQRIELINGNCVHVWRMAAIKHGIQLTRAAIGAPQDRRQFEGFPDVRVLCPHAGN